MVSHSKNRPKADDIPLETITDVDYVDDRALLENTLSQAESPVHSLEQGARGISLYVNANKTELMCF